MRRLFKFGVQGILPLLVSALLSVFTGCTGMVEDELKQTRDKLDNLRSLVDAANQDLQDLQSIVALLDADHTIGPDLSSFFETDDGYELSFVDGRTIFIPYGKNGDDGETLIPVGVRYAEDSLLYWTVNGEWLLDADGNMMRAGATDGTDGVDGIVPQIRIEGDMWQISLDNGKTFTDLASCEEMNGIGVFSDFDDSDPSKFVIILADGTRLDIPYHRNVKIAFAEPAPDTLLIAAGELLPVPYEVLVEGASPESVVVTTGTDGTYFSRVVEGGQPGTGTVLVQAPEVFAPGYIILSAYCEGYSAVKMISFEEREVTPVADTTTIRLGSGSDTLKVTYAANFEYEVSCDTTWLRVVSNPADSTLTFIAQPNPADSVRTGMVTVFPKANPGYICATFVVLQASESVKVVEYEMDEKESSEGFSLENSGGADWTLDAPAAGGQVIIWTNVSKNVEKYEGNDADWFTYDVVLDGHYKIVIDVKPNESEEARSTIAEDGTDKSIQIRIRSIAYKFIINQAGKPAETPVTPGE